MRALAFTLLVAGCYGDVGPKLTITPNHASLFGQVDVTVSGDLAALGDVNYFAVDGIQVINPRWSSSGKSVTVTLQGAPAPGRVDVVVRGSGGRSIQHGVFTYDPPPSPVPLKWIAFGASFTQGTESLGIDPHTQTHGVSAVIARTAGVYLGLPLFNPQLAPPPQPSDYYPDCTQHPGTASAFTTLTSVVTSADTGLFDLRYGRLDWTLKNRNIAVGGATVFDILEGVHGAKALLAHVTNDPDIDPQDSIAPETTSMIDRVEALDPDIGFCTDLLGNDLDPAVTQTDDLAPEMITPVETIAPLLQQMMARLGKLRGHFFLANIPSLTFVPHVRDLRQALVDAGKDTSAFDAKAAQIDAMTDAYNQALDAAVAPYHNLHIVDFKQYVADVKAGVRVGGDWLTVDHWGGLLSLDDLHLTDTGYALYAQRFIYRINEVLGLRIPHVDVEAVHADDALAPSKTRAAGYTCVPPAM
jgi:hypothetical protein